MKRRRTYRLRLCASWLAGTSIGIIAIRNRMRPAVVEDLCREIVQSRESLREAQRLSKGMKA